MGRGLSSTDCLADRGDRQKDRATCRFTFCALALGQRLHDSDATLKAFLSRRQADALQSKQRLGDISQGTAAGLRQHANSLFLKGCLFSVHVTNGGSIDGSSAPQQCTCVHTHTQFSFRSLFYYSYTSHRPPVMFHSYLYLWRCGKMDVCQILMGKQTYFRACTNLHTVSTGQTYYSLIPGKRFSLKKAGSVFFPKQTKTKKQHNLLLQTLFYNQLILNFQDLNFITFRKWNPNVTNTLPLH